MLQILLDRGLGVLPKKETHHKPKPNKTHSIRHFLLYDCCAYVRGTPENAPYFQGILMFMLQYYNCVLQALARSTRCFGHMYVHCSSFTQLIESSVFSGTRSRKIQDDTLGNTAKERSTSPQAGCCERALGLSSVFLEYSEDHSPWQHLLFVLYHL